MKRKSFFLLFLSVVIACKNGDLSKALENIRQKYAPDKRVALFNVSPIFSSGRVELEGETNLPHAKAELIKTYRSMGLKVEDNVQMLPSPTLNGKHFGVVNVSVCNLRSNPKSGELPDHDLELSTQAILGTPLRVLKDTAGFYLVQTPDDYLGWLDDGGFTLMDSANYQNWMNSQRVVCLEDYVFTYEQPDEKSQKVSDLVAGSILQFVENQDKFIKVRFPDGRAGFVPAGKTMPLAQWLASRQPDAANILATAKDMMGRPYLWGGTSGKGMDCSGFTKTIFYLNGVLLPRDANQQAAVGEDVHTDTTLKNMQPGDLIFFGRKANAEQKERISHVAIYLGDGKIIHASNKVEIASMKRGDTDFAEYRLQSFVRSKRVIGSVGKNGLVALGDSPYYKIEKTSLAD